MAKQSKSKSLLHNIKIKHIAGLVIASVLIWWFFLSSKSVSDEGKTNFESTQKVVKDAEDIEDKARKSKLEEAIHSPEETKEEVINESLTWLKLKKFLFPE